jgi:hypothetical protein
MSGAARIKKARASHIWEREANEHYVEEQWCDDRLFEVERFEGTTQDPCCGFGRIVEAGQRAGLPIFGTDLVDRGFPDMLGVSRFPRSDDARPQHRLEPAVQDLSRDSGARAQARDA